VTERTLTPTPLNPTSQFVLRLSTADPMQDMAFHRVLERALDAYHTTRHQAAYWADGDKPDAERDGVIAAIASAAPGIVAFALHRVVESLDDQLTEEQAMALGDTAAALDLEVVEDITGANGTGHDA
jgi:hypothetical protein